MQSSSSSSSSSFSLSLLLLLSSCFLSPARCFEDLLHLHLPANYSRLNFVGAHAGGHYPFLPVTVETKLNLITIHEVHDMRQEMAYETQVIMQWEDRWLVNPGHGLVKYEYLSSRAVDLLWHPDLYVYWATSSSVGRAFDDFVSLEVDYETGRVQWAFYLSVRQSCEMNFDHFPMDAQTCHVLLGSFGSNETYQVFELVSLGSRPDYAKKVSAFDVSVWKLPPEMTSQTSDSSPDITYSVTGFTVSLRRRPLNFVFKTFLPTGMLVLLSWIGFFIPCAMVPGRMALLVTDFLMLVNIVNSEESLNPRTEIPTAADLWLRACMALVAAALIEYSVLLFMKYRMPLWNANRSAHNKSFSSRKRRVAPASSSVVDDADYDAFLGRLDTWAAVSFAAIFAAFNMGFWVHYSKHQHHSSS